MLCYFRGKGNVSPGGGRIEGEGGSNEYDTVNSTGSGEGSRGRGKPKKNSQAPVYAQVDKENRQGKPVCESGSVEVYDVQ